jgi:hypothetical protein
MENVKGVTSKFELITDRRYTEVLEGVKIFISVDEAKAILNLTSIPKVDGVLEPMEVSLLARDLLRGIAKRVLYSTTTISTVEELQGSLFGKPGYDVDDKSSVYPKAKNTIDKM